MSSSDTTTGQRSAGSGGGQGRGGGQGSGGGNRPLFSGRGQQATRPRGTTFRRSTSEMNGHVFQCSEEQSDRLQFKNTKEDLQAYVKTNLKYAEDLAPLFALTVLEPELTMPQEPGRPNPSRTGETIRETREHPSE